VTVTLKKYESREIEIETFLSTLVVFDERGCLSDEVRTFQLLKKVAWCSINFRLDRSPETLRPATRQVFLARSLHRARRELKQHDECCWHDRFGHFEQTVPSAE
jgi:hypothetical protein